MRIETWRKPKAPDPACEKCHGTGKIRKYYPADGNLGGVILLSDICDCKYELIEVRIY